MIARLTGRVEQIEADRCVIDVNGVGYLVQASTRTLAGLPSGEVVTVLVEMQVREDAITLFGFAEAAEREWVRLLTTVQGVGSRVALNSRSILPWASVQGMKQAAKRRTGAGPAPSNSNSQVRPAKAAAISRRIRSRSSGLTRSR